MKAHLHFLAFVLLAVSCASAPDPSKKQADILYNHGTEELINKNYTTAIGHLLKAAKLDSSNPLIHNNLGMAYYFKNEKELALQHIRRSLELDSKNTDARVNIASLMFEQGDFIGAEKNYLVALKDLSYEKHARTYFNLALIEIRKNQTSKAIGYLNSSVKEDNNYCPAWFQLGQIEYQGRRFKAASKHFHQARMGACVTDPAPLYWQAVTDIEMGEYLDARIKLDEVIEKFSNSSFAALAQQKMSEIHLRENSRVNQHSGSQSNIVEPPKF
jgi:type IV pilus assembly protein PilF